MAEPPTQVVDPEGAPTCVRARDVELRYGARVALRIERLVIPGERITAIIGPNGSGKSTFLAACSGLITPARGSLEIVGAPPGTHRARVAHVLQETVVDTNVPLTVREVVRMGCYARRGMFHRLTAEDRRTVQESMDRLGIAELDRRHLTELSGGQRQRVFVAQGLAQRADVLLLDEPATGLDIPTQERIAAAVEEERRGGCSVIYTTHSVGEAAQADYVVLLAGHVVAAGPPEVTLSAEYLEAAYEWHIATPEGTILIDDAHHQPSG